MSRLDQTELLPLKLPQPKRWTQCVNTAFLSVNGVRCDKLMLRGKDSLISDLYMLMFEGHLRKCCVLFSLSATAFTPKQHLSVVLWQGFSERVYH
jgi:hypothetical protein